MMTNVSIGILVGGHSTRMGRPKALLPIGNETLIERTARVASDVSDRILLLGAPFFDLPASLRGLPILPDPAPDLGPLGGLRSLLRASDTRAQILLACDMPHLSRELLQRLLDAERPGSAAPALTSQFDTIVPRSCLPRPQWHPCCAAYQATSLPCVEAAIARKQFGMIQLLSRLRVLPVSLAGEESRWVENWNEPSDVSNSPDALVEGN